MKSYIVLEKNIPPYSTDMSLAEQTETIQFLMLGPFCASAWLNIMADLRSFGMHESVQNGF